MAATEGYLSNYYVAVENDFTSECKSSLSVWAIWGEKRKVDNKLKENEWCEVFMPFWKESPTLTARY